MDRQRIQNREIILLACRRQGKKGIGDETRGDLIKIEKL
jgi:hypothetical protein